MTKTIVLISLQSAQTVNSTGSLWPYTHHSEAFRALAATKGAASRGTYQTDPTEVLPTRISAVGTGYKTLGFSIWSFSCIHSVPTANREESVKPPAHIPLHCSPVTAPRREENHQHAAAGWAKLAECTASSKPIPVGEQKVFLRKRGRISCTKKII